MTQKIDYLNIQSSEYFTKIKQAIPIYMILVNMDLLVTLPMVVFPSTSKYSLITRIK